MKSKIASFIMTILTLLMIGILVLLGLIIYNDMKGTGIVDEVQAFVSNVTISTGDLNSEIKTSEIIESSINSLKPSNETVNYSNIVVDKYYYNQLDEYSKIIYNALESNKENMKSGTFEINFGTQFSNLLLQSNGEDLLGKYYQSAIEAYTYDNPDVFYIEYQKLYLNIETTTRGNSKSFSVFLNSGNELNYLENEFPDENSVNLALNEIAKVKAYFIQNKKTNTYENIKMVHDYLVESIEYDESISKLNIYNVYGALVNKECVCEGYAKAFKYILDGMDIPCVIVSGLATNSKGNSENHAWNYVKVNGDWYAIDCTWDDPIIIGGGFVSNSQKYKYFLKGSNEFNTTHFANGQFTEKGQQFMFPTLVENNY